MNIVIVIKLSSSEVEEIILDHIRKQGFTAKGKIAFKVSTHEAGDQRDPYTVTEFTGVEVEANKP